VLHKLKDPIHFCADSILRKNKNQMNLDIYGTCFGAYEKKVVEALLKGL
jgi:hypothetical protein